MHKGEQQKCPLSRNVQWLSIVQTWQKVDFFSCGPPWTVKCTQNEQKKSVCILCFLFLVYINSTIFNKSNVFSESCTWGQIILRYFCRISKVWSAHLNNVSCFCLATDVRRQLDSVAPQTGPRLMICDSFNYPGYEQSSCSHYISRNSCCFSRGFDFLLYPCLIEAWQERGTSRHIQIGWTILWRQQVL